MIKIDDKLNLRAFCLAKSVELFKAEPVSKERVLLAAKEFEDYVLGNSELIEQSFAIDRIVYEYALKLIDKQENENVNVKNS